MGRTRRIIAYKAGKERRPDNARCPVEQSQIQMTKAADRRHWK
jgi:hypothetical protein